MLAEDRRKPAEAGRRPGRRASGAIPQLDVDRPEMEVAELLDQAFEQGDRATSQHRGSHRQEPRAQDPGQAACPAAHRGGRAAQVGTSTSDLGELVLPLARLNPKIHSHSRFVPEE